MRSIIIGGMLEKVPGADINDRAEIIEYVSSLPYAERISILSHESSLGSLLSDSISTESHDFNNAENNLPNATNNSASEPGLSGGGITELEEESQALKAAQAKIEAARQSIAAALEENKTSHSAFEETKTNSESLLANRCRLNEDIVQKTKEMKDLVIKEIESNARLAKANLELEKAIIEKNNEEVRLLNKAADQAEAEKLRKIAEAQKMVAQAEAQRVIDEKNANDAAEAALNESVEAADAAKVTAVQEAEARKAAALNEAEAAKAAALNEAEAAKAAAVQEAEAAKAAAEAARVAVVNEAEAAKAAAEAAKVAVVQEAEAAKAAAVQEAEVAKAAAVQEAKEKAEAAKAAVVNEAEALKNAATEEANAIYEELQAREKDTIVLDFGKGQELKPDEVPTLALPNCPAEVEGDTPQVEVAAPQKSALQLHQKSFDARYPKLKENYGRAPLGGGARFRQDLDEHFRPLMNEMILHESTELKKKLDALYAGKLEEMKDSILSRDDLTDEQKKEIDDIFEEYKAQTQSQESWLPDVKLYATYMKKSFEDFLQNSTIDFENNIERDAVHELEDCLLRVKTFGERKATQTVETCARSYVSKIEDIN